MRRALTLLIALLLLNAGCDIYVNGASSPADIPPVQFLRPIQDTETGTWVAAWVDPEGYAGISDATNDDSKE